MDNITQKGLVLIEFFTNKFGKERAQIILHKVVDQSILETWDIEKIKKVGVKWHWSNLFFNGKCSKEEFMKNLESL